MAIETNDIIKITARLLVDGIHELINVFTARVLDDNGNSQDDILDDVAEYLDDAYGEIDAVMANNITFSTINVYNVSKSQPEGVLGWPTLTAGGEAGEYLPLGVACGVVGRTNVSRVLGRKFLPGVTETDTTDGIIGTGFRIPAALFAADWIAIFTGTNGTQLDPGVVNEELLSFVRLDSAVVIAEPWYQRRRSRRV